MNKRESGRGNKPDPEERKRKETEEPRKSEVDIQGRRKKELAAETGRMMEGHRERRDLEESHTQRTAQAGVDVPSSDGIHGTMHMQKRGDMTKRSQWKHPTQKAPGIVSLGQTGFVGRGGSTELSTSDGQAWLCGHGQSRGLPLVAMGLLWALRSAGDLGACA